MLHASVCKKKVPLGTDKCSINLKTMEQLVACVVRLTASQREEGREREREEKVHNKEEAPAHCALHHRTIILLDLNLKGSARVTLFVLVLNLASSRKRFSFLLKKFKVYIIVLALYNIFVFKVYTYINCPGPRLVYVIPEEHSRLGEKLGRSHVLNNYVFSTNYLAISQVFWTSILLPSTYSSLHGHQGSQKAQW